jgi:hypothetical protein
MNRRHIVLVMAGTIGASGLGLAGAAHAQVKETPTDEAAVMTNAKITLSQAISAAEQSAGGKSVGSGIEDQDGNVFFEVEVLKDGSRQKVLVDTQSGKVVKTAAADDEQQEGGREDGDDDKNGEQNDR